MRIFGKRILSLILTTCMLASSMLSIANANTPDQFKDFPDNWSTQAVTAALNNGLLHGYEDNTIRAEGMLTRAEMATVINNAFGAVIKADISAYKDVSPDSWYYDEIAKGVNMRTFIGGGDGYMFPDNAITREETFVVIARAFVLSGDNTASLDKFVDKDSISSWAVNSIAALAERGYVNGDELSRLNPKNNITRAEFAVLMDNIVKNYYSKEGTYTGTIDGTVLVNAGGVTFSNAVINGDLIIGDGVHIGDIRLENVTVNGRILARGPQKPGKIYIVKSTVRDGIVVNNVNGTVYFDNYQSDVFFNNLLSNTPVEFKKPSGSGGGSSSSSSSSTKYVVTFVDGKDYDGNPIEVKKYKVTKGKTLADMGYEMPSAKITYTQTGNSTNNYSHDVYQVGWYDENRTEYKADTIIDKDVTLHPGWKDLSVTASTERFNIPEVAVSLSYEPDERVIDAATDLFFANRKTVLAGLTQYEDKVLEQPAAQRFITSDKQIKIVNLDMSFSDIFGSTESFKSIFQDQIDDILASIPEESRGQAEVKIDKAFEQIAVEKIWHLNGDNMPEDERNLYKLLAEEIYKGTANMDYDSTSQKIPDEIKKVFGEDIIKREYNEAIDDFAARIKYVLDNDADTLDCALRISINPIDDILKPSYSRYIAKIVDRLGNYYTENQYLVEIKEIMTPDNLLVKEGNATDELSGYKLKSYDEYYDIMEKAVLLSDGAITTFSEAAVDSGNLEELVSLYVDLGYTYYPRIIDLVKKALTYTDYTIDVDSILPSDEAIEGQRENIKKYATALVKNPDLTTKEAIENGLSLVGTGVTWEEFEKTITKGQETITIKNRTYIPDLKNNN